MEQELKNQLYQFVGSLCSYAGETEEFFLKFWQRLIEEQDICEELTYYMEHQNFLCHAKSAGYSVIDIMVWQIDHFKANMDRGNDAMKNQGDTMLLMAFDTLLKMRQEPEKYIAKMQEETGTDYPGKY